jgi:cyclopropane-fatty-acyl-phospholipid synthase
MSEAKFCKNLVFKLLSKMKTGRLAWSEEGFPVEYFGEGDGIEAEIRVKDKVFYKKLVLFGDIGFGESFMDGDWETTDLVQFISWLIQNLDKIEKQSAVQKVFSPLNLLKAYNRVSHSLKPNSISGSKKNISEHYDLSNEFFQLFLDPSMTYSSAFFETGKESLEKAQQAKYELMCQSIKLKSTDHVLEIGCGWGGFALYTAKNFGCKVTGITISKRQFELATERVKNENLEDKIKIVFQDYRLMEGNFDKIVSIEMIEAVGHQYFNKYFKKIDSLLAKNGIVGLQAIIIPDKKYDEYRKSVDWIQKYIFPGGLLPSIAKINQSMNEASMMNLYNLREFGLSYAKTLKSWKLNMFQNLSQINEMGFDDKFIRKWEYYFSYCEAAFQQRNINLVQLVYSRPNNPEI